MPPVSEQKVREIIRQELGNFLLTDKYVFDKLIQFADGRNIQLGKTTGTKFGTATNQKQSFYGVTPIIQPAKINEPTGGSTQDLQARGAINELRLQQRDIGLLAQS